MTESTITLGAIGPPPGHYALVLAMVRPFLEPAG
jgi:hypothetical protein